MQEKIKDLFNANIVLSNSRLDQMIADTMSRYSSRRELLSDEDVECIAAAGDAFSMGDSFREEKDCFDAALKPEGNPLGFGSNKTRKFSGSEE